MKYIAILLSKMTYKIMKLLKYKSSVFPGFIAHKLYPNILKEIKFPKINIMVTGSSGKGSTTKIINKVLTDNNYKVIYNNDGSNLINAFITLIIKNCDLKGTINADVLLFETDERFLKEITKYVVPDYLLINNITRDQPPRQGNFDIIFEEIKKGIKEKTHLIVNGDDPITRRFSLYHKNITYYGIEKNFMSTTKEINHIKDNLYCPNCNSKLHFDYYHYNSIGNYKCPNCNFKRDNISYSITKIDKNNMNIIINKKYKINISNYLLFNLYNIISCFSLCDLLKIKKENIINSLDNFKLDKKIYEEFTKNKRKYYVLNCKAENNVTYNLSLLFTSIDNEEKTIVLGLKEISRRYNHFDISWLWDISFELLTTSNVNKVICIGPYRYDIACRVNYAGIDENNIIIIDEINDLKKKLKQTNGSVYGILNFDYVDPFKLVIKGEK